MQKLDLLSVLDFEVLEWCVQLHNLYFLYFSELNIFFTIAFSWQLQLLLSYARETESVFQPIYFLFAFSIGFKKNLKRQCLQIYAWLRGKG